MFINELQLYIDFFAKEAKESLPNPNKSTIEYLDLVKTNLLNGIEYYKTLIPKLVKETTQYKDTMKTELTELKKELDTLIQKELTPLSISQA